MSVNLRGSFLFYNALSASIKIIIQFLTNVALIYIEMLKFKTYIVYYIFIKFFF